MKIVGYITSDPLRLGFVSHQLQNSTVRSYVESLNHDYLLSWTEYKGRAPFVFRSLLEESFYQGICFYSLEQILTFPAWEDMLLRLEQNGLWIGFAREEISFQGSRGLEQVRRYAWMKQELEGQRPDLKFLGSGI